MANTVQIVVRARGGSQASWAVFALCGGQSALVEGGFFSRYHAMDAAAEWQAQANRGQLAYLFPPVQA